MSDSIQDVIPLKALARWVSPIHLGMIAAAFAYPSRLILQGRWGERALLMGGPLSAILWALVLTILGASGQLTHWIGANWQYPFLISLIPFFVLLWVYRLIRVWEFESARSWPLSSSMGFLSWMPRDKWTSRLANVIPILPAVWCASAEAYLITAILIIGSIGGITGDILFSIAWRANVLNQRDGAIFAEVLGTHVVKGVDDLETSNSVATPDLTEIYAR